MLAITAPAKLNLITPCSNLTIGTEVWNYATALRMLCVTGTKGGPCPHLIDTVR